MGDMEQRSLQSVRGGGGRAIGQALALGTTLIDLNTVVISYRGMGRGVRAGDRRGADLQHHPHAARPGKRFGGRCSG